VSRNIFRTCKVGVEAGGQLYDLLIKQDLFKCVCVCVCVCVRARACVRVCVRVRMHACMLEIGYTISAGRSCLICDRAPVTAAKLREKAESYALYFGNSCTLH